jgi:hypothetical protein
MTTKNIKTQTEAWLTSFIINYNICPFAKREHDRSSVRYSVVETNELDQCLESVFKECQYLDSEAEIETTLLIFPNNFKQFDDYLDFLNLAESLLIDQHYEGIYQLASFHPDYCFDGENSNDPANYTNRSPYPMLHLIRERSLEHALSSYPHPEEIPERNIALTRQLGLKKLQAILQKCYSN